LLPLASQLEQQQQQQQQQGRSSNKRAEARKEQHSEQGQKQEQEQQQLARQQLQQVEQEQEQEHQALETRQQQGPAFLVDGFALQRQARCKPAVWSVALRSALRGFEAACGHHVLDKDGNKLRLRAAGYIDCLLKVRVYVLTCMSVLSLVRCG